MGGSAASCMSSAVDEMEEAAWMEEIKEAEWMEEIEEAEWMEEIEEAAWIEEMEEAADLLRKVLWATGVSIWRPTVEMTDFLRPATDMAC